MRKRVGGACSVALTLAAAAAAQTPAGGEFRVNTYTTGRQDSARVAMEPDGDFVVVWTGPFQDGSSNGIFGQRFAASGAPRGNEFRINTYTTGFQGSPAIAVGSGGDFVVVWRSGQDGSGSSIEGQRFDASGASIGGEFRVNTFTTGVQDRPRIGRGPDGRFVVSWVSPNDGSAYGIAARRFDAAGEPTGSEFVVNTYTVGDQGLADVAVEANGNFVVVWPDYNNRDGSAAAVVGQRYDASGNRIGGEFQVNTYTTGAQRYPSVSVSPAGGFVVAWPGYGDGDSYGVFARRFDAAGNAMGSDFLVNTYTTGTQSGIFGVAHESSGDFVITWGGHSDGSYDGVFAQRFGASGDRLGAEFRVNTYTTGRQTQPSVAADSLGNFVIVWDGYGPDGSDHGIFAQRYGDLIFEDGFDSAIPVAER